MGAVLPIKAILENEKKIIKKERLRNTLGIIEMLTQALAQRKTPQLGCLSNVHI